MVEDEKYRRALAMTTNLQERDSDMSYSRSANRGKKQHGSTSRAIPQPRQTTAKCPIAPLKDPSLGYKKV